MAARARRAAVLDHPIGAAVARERLQAPASRGGMGAAILAHDAHEFARPLDQRASARRGGEEIEGEDGSVGVVPARLQGLERPTVRVDVVDAAVK